jgi:hypothetical protein
LSNALWSWPLLKFGGIIIFNNYLYRLHKPRSHIPRGAIDAFLMINDQEIEVIFSGYMLMARKKRNPCLEAGHAATECSSVGRFLYFWSEHRLSDPAITLDDDEWQTLEAILHAKVPGENRYNLDFKLRKSAAFRTLEKKLGMSF